MNNREYYEKFGELQEDAENSQWTSAEIEMSDKSYAQLLVMNAALREENAELERRVKELEKENGWMTASLSDMSDGMDALYWHIQVANSAPENPPANTEFAAAYACIRLTHKALKNIIGEWEDRMETPYSAIPF